MERPGKKLIYISGKYTGDIDENISIARTYACELWEEGYAVICPHLNTSHMERDCKATYEDFIEGDFEMVRRVDAVFMLPEWEMSKGANLERRVALERNIPVFYTIKDINAWRDKR